MKACKKDVKIAAIVINSIAVLVICAILIGSTFAWFTDSAISSGNKIQAGTLKVDLELLDEEGNWNSIKNDSAPIFDYDKWEPGYTDVKILKIENEGTLALQWKAKIVSEKALSKLADVIDVYVLPSATELTYPADRDLEGYTYVGTVADFIDSIESTTTGTLLAGEVSYLGLALKMSTEIGNEYQGLDLGGAIDVVIVATQISSEDDGFNNGYDSDASLDWTPVSSAEQLRIALANREYDIVLQDDVILDGSFEEGFSVIAAVRIDGNGYSIMRGGVATYSTESAGAYTGTVFTVKEGVTLELIDVTVDGGAVWSGDVDSVLGRGVENIGVTATGALIATEARASIVLGEGAIVQNNDGANAINLGTRVGATLIIDGGEVINNNSGAGAIWGGGNITLNEGKINGNSSTGLAGAIRMVSNCNFTMNAGEVRNNKAVTNGGAIYGYGASVYNLNGGKIANNHAAIAGAIYSGDSSTINIRDNFMMVNNTADQAGAMRLDNRTTVNMTGGVISGNVSKENPNWDGFYGWNPAISFKGGVLADNVTIHGGLTPTVGGVDVTGVINFSISTTHNTVNLVEDFGSFKFTVNEGSNFSAFNFKPAESYTYVDGDENKLICLNEGYTTYFDQTTGTFRLTEAE